MYSCACDCAKYFIAHHCFFCVFVRFHGQGVMDFVKRVATDNTDECEMCTAMLIVITYVVHTVRAVVHHASDRLK